MTAFERATGWVFGVAPLHSRRADWRRAPTARQALEDLLRPLMTAQGPLHVSFSGGIDSSLLLAVAVDVAQREGLPPPVPVTNFFPGDNRADETDWQRLVLRHLGVEQFWHRIRMDPAEDIVGPAARSILRRRGVCWPPLSLVNFRATCAAVPAGSSLITGDGGDEVFGERRITPLVALRRRGPSRYLIEKSLGAAAPERLRRRHRRRHVGEDLDYMTRLRPRGRADMVEAYLDDSVAEPLEHWRSTEFWATRHAVLLGQRNMRALAADHGVRAEFPLWAAEFTAAMQREGRTFGWLGRAEIVDRIAGDLLPPSLVHRTTKASFNSAVFGDSARAVMSEWDGDGLDDDLVDSVALRKHWAAEAPVGPSEALLQEVALIVDR